MCVCPSAARELYDAGVAKHKVSQARLVSYADVLTADRAAQGALHVEEHSSRASRFGESYVLVPGLATAALCWLALIDVPVEGVAQLGARTQQYRSASRPGESVRARKEDLGTVSLSCCVDPNRGNCRVSQISGGLCKMQCYRSVLVQCTDKAKTLWSSSFFL